MMMMMMMMMMIIDVVVVVSSLCCSLAALAESNGNIPNDTDVNGISCRVSHWNYRNWIGES